MRRRVWGIFAVVSVLALAGVTVMWVRSHRVADVVGYEWRFTAHDGVYWIRYTAVGSVRGTVQVGAGHFLPLNVPLASLGRGLYAERRVISSSATRATPAWSVLGLEYHRIELPTGFYSWSIGVPYWFLCACAAAMSFLAWWRWRRARRKVGTCARCGYDLRESRERCPECGTPVPGGGGSDNIAVPAKDGVRQW